MRAFIILYCGYYILTIDIYVCIIFIYSTYSVHVIVYCYYDIGPIAIRNTYFEL